MALSGLLLRGGQRVDQARELIEQICKAAGDEEVEDRAGTVSYTHKKISAGEPATGGGRLSQLIDDRVVKVAAQWLNLTSPVQTEWAEPIPFEETTTPEIPASLLPGVHGDYARALAVASETAEALSVMTVLGVLSTVLNMRFVVNPKPGWNEPVNLYILVALPPANNKSLVLRKCTEVLDFWEFDQLLTVGPTIQKAKSQRRSEEAQIASIRARGAKETNPAKQAGLFQQASQLEQSLTQIPVKPQLYLNDTTPESLTTAVVEQNGRLGIISDEGGIMETMAGLYSKGQSNYDLLLKGIDGGAVRLRRKETDVSVYPYLAILLLVQPQVLQNMAERKALQGRGLLERFLYVIPRSTLGSRTLSTPPVPAPLEKAYKSAIDQLLALPAKTAHLGIHVPDFLTLDDQAMAVWHAFRMSIEAQLCPNGRLASCPGWGGKIAGMCLRVAGLLHVAEHGPGVLVISGATMGNAVALCEHLTDHALLAFGLMSIDQATQDAEVLF